MEIALFGQEMRKQQDAVKTAEQAVEQLTEQWNELNGIVAATDENLTDDNTALIYHNGQFLNELPTGHGWGRDGNTASSVEYGNAASSVEYRLDKAGEDQHYDDHDVNASILNTAESFVDNLGDAITELSQARNEGLGTDDAVGAINYAYTNIRQAQADLNELRQKLNIDTREYRF